MKTVFNIFQELKDELPANGDSFVIASLPSMKNHKIGITKKDQPIFFIKCDNTAKSKTLDTNLEFISVQFNRQCQLINQKKKTEEGIYTIILLKTDIEYLQEYFIKIVDVLLRNLSDSPLLKDLKIEIDKLINLFSKFTKPPLKTIQGLWAELLIIEQSVNPEYLIQSWHNSSSDKYDFNDGIDKIEVKSTLKSRRIHSFSIEQLTPNKNSQLLIASIFTIETGTGTNISALIENIENRIKDNNLSFRLNELAALTLGKDFEKSFDVYFDYQFALDSIQFYRSTDIQTIKQNNIPSNIMNVRFDCDLSNLKTVDKKGIKSKLHNSLF
jgi:hypothetical protein